MKTIPHISVCMPMYNASRYLRECIDSVLGQTFHDFEFLIVDDGSTDDSVEIVELYTDPRIRLIRREHDYIASLNCLIDEARGEYIARMDADDVMLPNRLQQQFDYMESHPDIDVLGGNIMYIGDNTGYAANWRGDVTMLQLIEGCVIAHPTVLIRRDALVGNKIHYRHEYVYAEDYALWVELLQCGCRLYNHSDVVLQYRASENQISSLHSHQQMETTAKIKATACTWFADRCNKISNSQICGVDSDNKLSVVIPFLDEYHEVINTVKSIRDTAGDTVDIIVINDHSSPDFDYKGQLLPYGVRYYENEIRIGAALSKERGVNLSRTPYFIIIDAHMRFFTDNWADILTNELRANPNRLVCCETVPIRVTEDDKVEVDRTHMPCRGAYLTFREDNLIPGIKWLENRVEKVPGLQSGQACAVLGACYASSKVYWQQLSGMMGLLHFGCEEACISIKSWLLGGGCYHIPDIVIGHIYKPQAPYFISNSAFMYNYLAIAEMLFPTSDKCLAHSVARAFNAQHYVAARALLNGNISCLEKVHDMFADFIKDRFDFIIDININASAIQHSVITNAFGNINDVLSSVISSPVEAVSSCGFLDGGASGRLLFLLSYLSLNPKRANADEVNYSMAMYAFMKLKIEERHLHYDFNSGLSGIGWTLLYMHEHQLLDDDLDELLAVIDDTLSEYSPHRISDTSFNSGLGGIYCYVVNRIHFSGQQHRLNPSFLEELHDVALHILGDESTDLRTSTYALQYVKTLQHLQDAAYATMRMIDVVSPCRFFPSDKNLWQLNYHNVLGYAQELLSLKNQFITYDEKEQI